MTVEREVTIELEATIHALAAAHERIRQLQIENAELRASLHQIMALKLDEFLKSIRPKNGSI